jgi:putative acetyltransferase
MHIDIRKASITSHDAARLIAALNAELSAIYPEQGANHFRLDAEEVADGRGSFLIAYVGGEACACGAIRKIDARTAEIKRMYVAWDARGRGLAGKMLAELESEALKLEVDRLVLETGIRQPAAIALYRRSGFVDAPAFDEYLDSPLSICMHKTIRR